MKAMHEVLEAHCEQLTARQSEAFRLMANGSTLKAVAGAMSITRYAARDHSTKIFKKFGWRNRAHMNGELIVEALRLESTHERLIVAAQEASA